MEKTEMQNKLREPFKPEDIQWRIIKSGKAKSGNPYAIVAPYVDSRAIMERLDDVVGIEGWETLYTETIKGFICQLKINGITKSDGADCTNIEPTKGGISDALKRAGVPWGIGRYLYKLDTQFAIVTPNGKHDGNYKLKDKAPVYFKWNPPKLPDWASPNPKNSTQKTPPALETETFTGKMKWFESQLPDFKAILGREGFESIAEIQKDKQEYMIGVMKSAHEELKIQAEG